MNNYLLFIDTEATDLPKDWTKPFDTPGNWPHAVQISWVVYDKHRVEVKREDHYIKLSENVQITESALKVHGITTDHLDQHGHDIKQVLQLFIDDITFYNPLVIGHFIKLDYYVLAAELFRAGMPNVLEDKPVFCTMIASHEMVQNPIPRQLRLDEFYHFLFYKDLIHPHNALYDAKHAADCYFELIDRGEITPKIVEQQNLRSIHWRNLI